MSASAPTYAVDVVMQAVAALRDDAAWTAYLAAIATARPGKLVLASQPADGDVEACLADLDEVSPPQRFPCHRIDVLQSDDTQGLNWTVGRTVHTLELRTFILRAGFSDLIASQRSNLTSVSLALSEQQRAAAFILTAGLAPAGNDLGIYNVIPTGNQRVTAFNGQGNTLMLRSSITFQVWQTTRSPRFNATPQGPP